MWLFVIVIVLVLLWRKKSEQVNRSDQNLVIGWPGPWNLSTYAMGHRERRGFEIES